ncbi:lipocalin-like domain-containing protein [Flavobacterium silvaticum]|uniref:Extracellular endo-alpha-(1->5)-L-arabinanase C-terminal domain-containing protein n=1 Tax=Flavobacterium silvaticum TaxID=1852020 RepID=A0A972FLL6_9FLAO|nr:glycoside hydrolase family 43 C-terminal domain-containing protein [Flavobacterium silvaticum]NMH27902.1 hypothetical protein [Flavobacterium silvaticum]
MKKLMSFCAIALFFIAASASAQSAKEIVGQWRLVSGTDASGKALDVKAMHKSENVFNKFKEDGTYMHVAGAKVETGTWSLSPDNKKLTVSINGKTTEWTFVSFGDDKATITGNPGTMNYVKY